MAKKRRPTLVSAALLVGTIILTGGTAALAINPVSRMMAPTRSDVATSPVDSSARLSADSVPKSTSQAEGPNAVAADPVSALRRDPALAPAKAPSAPAPADETSKADKPSKASKTITYVVKRGDTLSGIATWFKDRGFGAIYRANRAVIGNNPDLIFPGQRITISGSTMTVGGHR